VVEFVVKKAKKKEAPPKQRDDDYVVGKGTGAGPAKYDWDEVGGAALSNAGSSFKQNFVDPFLHPIDTLSGIAGLGADAFRKAGGFVAPEGTFGETPTLDALLNHYKETYGSGGEGFRRALAEDPFGPVGDLLTLVSGGAGGVAKIAGTGSKAGRVGKIANIVKKAANIDPMYWGPKLAVNAVSGLGKTGREALGLTTGVGADNIDEAYRSGLHGGQREATFQRNLNKDTPDNLTAEARRGVRNMRSKASADYQTDYDALVKDSRVQTDWQPVRTSTAKWVDSLTNRGNWAGGAEAERIANKVLDDLQRFDVPGSRDVEGMSFLRKAVKSNEITPGPNTSGSVLQANRLIGGILDAIDTEMEAKVPGFGKMNADYGASKENVKNIEQAFSLGKKSSEETSGKKIATSGRDAVDTNYGQRGRYAKELEDAGAVNLRPAVAGQTMSPRMPRGMGARWTGGLGAAAAGGAGFVSPWAALAIPAAPLFSPRFVGRAAQYTGKASKQIPQPVKDAVKAAGKAGYKYSGPAARGARVANIAETQREKFLREFLLDNPKFKGM
jgi:hypothetical protein